MIWFKDCENRIVRANERAFVRFLQAGNFAADLLQIPEAISHQPDSQKNERCGDDQVSLFEIGILPDDDRCGRLGGLLGRKATKEREPASALLLAKVLQRDVHRKAMKPRGQLRAPLESRQ